VIYTLDTNVFVDAFRQDEARDRLKHFLEWALRTCVLSSVVAAELLQGSRTDAERRGLDDDVLSVFRRRDRIVAPSREAWYRTGTLTGRGGAHPISASWQNDVLIAHQARESGWTVITRDRDFDVLRKEIAGLRAVAPFPARR
jgi:predicted nucleic acid-binding protein